MNISKIHTLTLGGGQINFDRGVAATVINLTGEDLGDWESHIEMEKPSLGTHESPRRRRHVV